MQNRKPRRRTFALLSAVGLAALGSSSADAGLFLDLRALGATTSGSGVLDPKNVALAAPGDTITVGLFASVTGTNGVNDDTIQSLNGMLNSVGSLKGNLSGGYVPAFFTAGITQNGSVLDWDSDGDLDIGMSPTNSTIIGKFVARSNTPTAMPSIGGDVQIGQFVFTSTTASGTASINFSIRNNNGNNLAQAALWFEDGLGSGTSRNPTTGAVTIGSPVNTPIPEPSTLGLMALATGGLLKRRRQALES